MVFIKVRNILGSKALFVKSKDFTLPMYASDKNLGKPDLNVVFDL